jgi:hypothetical protein
MKLPSIIDMNPEERAAVVERLIAHLKFASQEADVVGDQTTAQSLGGFQAVLEEHCLSISAAPALSSTRFVEEAVRLLAGFYVKCARRVDEVADE